MLLGIHFLAQYRMQDCLDERLLSTGIAVNWNVIQGVPLTLLFNLALSGSPERSSFCFLDNVMYIFKGKPNKGKEPMFPLYPQTNWHVASAILSSDTIPDVDDV